MKGQQIKHIFQFHPLGGGAAECMQRQGGGYTPCTLQSILH
jgi:hypothetical protein